MVGDHMKDLWGYFWTIKLGHYLENDYNFEGLLRLQLATYAQQELRQILGMASE